GGWFGNALHAVCSRGHKEIAEMLLEKGWSCLQLPPFRREGPLDIDGRRLEYSALKEHHQDPGLLQPGTTIFGSHFSPSCPLETGSSGNES
ncbi:hypothetical protein C8A05DRAFT_19525, partial [Staphylotrichum tortipilum]